MRLSKKTILALVLCIGAFFMAVGYSILMTELKINGTANITSTWDISITGITCDSNGSAYNIEQPTYTATSAKFRVAVVSPGDQMRCTVTIKNQGNLTGILNGIDMSSSGSDAISYTISGLKEGDTIAAGDTKYLYVYSNYSSYATVDPDERMKKLTVDLDWVQYTNQSITTKTYTIKYNSNGGSGSMSSTTCNIGSSCSLRANSFTKSGYVFDGWALSSDGVAMYKNSASVSTLTSAGKSVTLYAVWSNTLPDIILANNSESSIPVYTYYPDGAGSYFQTHNRYTSSVSFTSSTTYYFANNFTFNPSTGVYSLYGTTTSGTWSAMSSSYSTYPYTCRGTSSAATCTTLYKMYSYSSATAGSGYAYNRSAAGLYYASSFTENNKSTYFFRGDVTNNYVSFAGKTWRIVRINEDGSVRLILNTTTGSTLKFATYSNSHAYVGYMYGNTSALTYEDTHSNDNDSVIKETLDTWYENNLINYSAYLADAGFCNDRSVSSGLGYGANNSGYYGFYGRTSKPQFACPNSTRDLFTTSTSNKGNKALTYPIGTLSADEVLLAGGNTNSSSTATPYFYNGSLFWTMTPASYIPSTAYNYLVGGYTNIMPYGSAGTTYARPVINLKADVIVSSGSGTSSSPYVIATAQ